MSGGSHQKAVSPKTISISSCDLANLTQNSKSIHRQRLKRNMNFLPAYVALQKQK